MDEALVTQPACNLILLILLSKYLSFDLRIQLVSILCHAHILHSMFGFHDS